MDVRLKDGNVNLDKLSAFEANNAALFSRFIDEINGLGYNVDIISGKRTYAEQARLKQANSKNAKPGYSTHEFGKAIDIGCYNVVTRVYLTKSTSSKQWIASGIVGSAERLGLTWGGNAFSNYADNNHFQIGGVKAPKPSGKPGEVPDSTETTEPNKDTIIGAHKNTDDLITVEAFIKKWNIKKSSNKNDYYSKNDLINYRKNKQAILNSLTTGDRKKAEDSGITVIGTGAIIEYSIESIGNSTVYSVNENLVLNTDSNAFIEANIKAIVTNENYRRINNSISDPKDGTLYKKFINCSVFVYAKAFSTNGEVQRTINESGELINITPFIIQMQTNVGKTGGNWNITLPHLDFQSDREGYADLFKNESFIHANINTIIDSIDNVKKITLNDVPNDDDEVKYYHRRNYSFFNKYLQKQDLIFIRFEKLEIEEFNLNIEPFIGIRDLNGQQFDMIGLIDKVTESSNPADKSITISGMDLSQILIDDSIFFFPILYGVKDKGVYLKETSLNGVAKRLTIDPRSTPTLGGNSNYTYGISSKVVSDRLDIMNYTGSIREWLMWLFSQLTSIEVVPDKLLQDYAGTDQTLIVTNSEDKSKESSNEFQFLPANGIWKICKLVLDKNIETRRLADTSIASSTGSLMSIVKKIVQDPFVEFNMDTWGIIENGKFVGSQYFFMARKAPFSEKAFKSLPCINIYDDHVLGDSLSWSDEIYTMFHLTPQGNGILSANSISSMLALPVVVINQYVAIWGAKMLDITTNYLDFNPVLSADTSKILQNSIKQSLEDLDWLITAYAMMPFTRQGTITLKGDRRIKRGMIIRYFPTGELFYVVSVQNSISFGGQVDRVTTIQVIRGIFEYEYDRYFNIVTRNKGGSGDSDSTWTLNEENFLFLLQKQQVV